MYVLFGHETLSTKYFTRAKVAYPNGKEGYGIIIITLCSNASQGILLAWQNDRKSVVHKGRSPNCICTWVNSAEVWLVKLVAVQLQSRETGKCYREM